MCTVVREYEIGVLVFPQRCNMVEEGESIDKSFEETEREGEIQKVDPHAASIAPREGRGEEKANEGGRERQKFSRRRRVGRREARECEMEAAALKKKYIYRPSNGLVPRTFLSCRSPSRTLPLSLFIASFPAFSAFCPPLVSCACQKAQSIWDRMTRI